MGNSESLGQFQEAIAGLKSNKVEKLYLAGNGIRAEGAARLAEALKHNNSLTALYLGGNQIGAEDRVAWRLVCAHVRACVGLRLCVCVCFFVYR